MTRGKMAAPPRDVCCCVDNHTALFYVVLPLQLRRHDSSLRRSIALLFVCISLDLAIVTIGIALVGLAAQVLEPALTLSVSTIPGFFIFILVADVWCVSVVGQLLRERRHSNDSGRRYRADSDDLLPRTDASGLMPLDRIIAATTAGSDDLALPQPLGVARQSLSGSQSVLISAASDDDDDDNDTL